MPVGGWMSASSLVRAAGARTRLANVVANLVMAVLVLLCGGALGYVAMPALPGLLILVGARTFRLDNVVMVWRTGGVQVTTMSTTFVLTLLVPLQYALLAGVGVSVVLYVTQQSNKDSVVRWTLTQQRPRKRRAR